MANTAQNRILFSAPEIEVSRLVIDADAEIYNVMECSSNTAVRSVDVHDLNIPLVKNLKHNILSIYKFEDNASVKFSDCSFDINPEATNVLRLCNLTNAKNVKVLFENVDWTFENAGATDFEYAGLVLYQPWKTDSTIESDMEVLNTWSFTFRNCRYNGKKIDGVNFGEHSQVILGYGIGGNVVTDLTEITEAEFVFE